MIGKMLFGFNKTNLVLPGTVIVYLSLAKNNVRTLVYMNAPKDKKADDITLGDVDHVVSKYERATPVCALDVSSMDELYQIHKELKRKWVKTPINLNVDYFGIGNRLNAGAYPRHLVFTIQHQEDILEFNYMSLSAWSLLTPFDDFLSTVKLNTIYKQNNIPIYYAEFKNKATPSGIFRREVGDWIILAYTEAMRKNHYKGHNGVC